MAVSLSRGSESQTKCITQQQHANGALMAMNAHLEKLRIFYHTSIIVKSLSNTFRPTLEFRS